MFTSKEQHTRSVSRPPGQENRSPVRQHERGNRGDRATVTSSSNADRSEQRRHHSKSPVVRTKSMERSRGQYEKDEKKESNRAISRSTKDLDRKEQQREKERSQREKEKEQREKEREKERKTAQKDKKKKRKEEKAAEKKRKKEKKEKRDRDGKKSSKTHSHYSSGAEDSSHKHMTSSDPEMHVSSKASNIDASHHSTTPPPQPQPQSQPQPPVSGFNFH